MPPWCPSPLLLLVLGLRRFRSRLLLDGDGPDFGAVELRFALGHPSTSSVFRGNCGVPSERITFSPPLLWNTCFPRKENKLLRRLSNMPQRYSRSKAD